ncbi:terminase gpP N-terminus-related DNA-binding protein [Sphingomonas sp. Leaf4]|uniref:terminase gpP N-terminus-related DNA-binding protein n=1 Tax=Sphingomonas sp. Leaf4 TaxID=2876553 RepID=UPI001E603440|nr:hypothetical protein [Sphingomonas sp. Leaf4]
MSILANPLALHADPLTLPVEDRRRAARSLYWRGWEVSQIAGDLQVPRTTVQSWKDRGKWDDAPSIRRMEDCLEARWMVLIAKVKKTGEDYKEIDLLGRQIAALAKVRRYEEPGGHEGDLNDKVANRNSGPRKEKAKSNHFTAEQAANLKEIFLQQLFGYQETWWANLTVARRRPTGSRSTSAMPR